MNTAFLGSFVWQLKIITVFLGAIDLGLTTARNVYGIDSKAEFFLAMVIVCFMISVIWVIFAMLDALAENELLSKVDFFYHASGGVLLVIGAICWFVFTSEGCKNHCKSHYIQQIMAGIFGLINGVLYMFVAFILFRSGTPAN